MRQTSLSVSTIMKQMTSLFILPLLVVTTTTLAQPIPQSIEVDVCVYTATPSGILAAIAVKREGRSVVIVEPSRWVGGMLGAGLKPWQDCPNYTATGGMTRRTAADSRAAGFRSTHLDRGDASRATARRAACSKHTNSRVTVRTPFAKTSEKLLHEHGIQVIMEHRIARCEMRGATIAAATFDLAPFDALGCPVPEPTTARQPASGGQDVHRRRLRRRFDGRSRRSVIAWAAKRRVRV